MKKFITIVGALAVLLVGTVASAQTFPVFGQYKQPIYSAVIADDTDVAVVIRYVGPAVAGACTVQSATGAGITFVTNGAADTSFECPIAAPLGGVIDTTNAACNELGEVVDSINSSRNAAGVQLWSAFILDGLRTDPSNSLLTVGATDAKPTTGVNLLWDTSVIDQLTRALVPCRNFACQAPAGYLRPVVNPQRHTMTDLIAVTGNATFDGGGTGTWTIYSVQPISASGETVTQIWTQAGAATTVTSTIGASTWPWGLPGLNDTKIVLRYAGTGNTSTFRLTAYGVIFTN
jgi:hypothetical protein